MMFAMSLSTNSTEKYEKYDNWTPYSGTMTQKSAGWEYKSGKYLGESVVFYRNVPFDSRKKVKKHTVAYVLNSLTPNTVTFNKMIQLLRKHSSVSSNEFTVQDLRQLETKGKRKTKTSAYCGDCGNKISSTALTSGFCNTCTSRKRQKMQKEVLRQKKEKEEKEANILAKEANILDLKKQIREMKQESNKIKEKIFIINISNNLNRPATNRI